MDNKNIAKENPDPTRYDVDEHGGMSTKQAWVEKMDEEFKKKADYIHAKGMFDPAMMCLLTESGLSLIIHQIQTPEDEAAGDGSYTWALGCMSHGKSIQTEQVKREFIVKILRSFADMVEKGFGYFNDEPLKKLNDNAC